MERSDSQSQSLLKGTRLQLLHVIMMLMRNVNMVWVSPGVNTNVLSLWDSLFTVAGISSVRPQKLSFIEEQRQTYIRRPAKRQKTTKQNDDDWSDDERGKFRHWENCTINRCSAIHFEKAWVTATLLLLLLISFSHYYIKNCQSYITIQYMD